MNEIGIVEHILYNMLNFDKNFIERTNPTENDQKKYLKYMENIFDDINSEIDKWYDNFSDTPTYIRTVFIHSNDKEIFIEFLIDLEFIPTEKHGTIGKTIENYYIFNPNKQDNKLKVSDEIFKKTMLHLIMFGAISQHYVISELHHDNSG